MIAVAHYRELRELIELPTDTLRAIARGADAPERLWAAWALALRHDVAARTIARDLARGDPAPGVRAQMAIVLVAHGERDAAVVLARHDPEPLVRASACRCLARTLASDDGLLTDVLVSALQTDPSAQVRAAVVNGLRDDRPTRLDAACVGALSDADDEVRAQVVEALVRWHPAGAPLRPELREHWLREAKASTRDAILRAWVDAEGAASLLRGVEPRSARAAVHVIEFLLATGQHVAFEALEPLLTRGDERVDERVTSMHGAGLTEMPVAGLLEMVARASRDFHRSWERSFIAQAAAGLVQPRLASASSLGSARERALARDLVDHTETELARRLPGVPLTSDVVACLSAPDDYRYGARALPAALTGRDELLYDDEFPAVPALPLLADLRRLLAAC
jgi:hypothetical protein